MKGVSAIAPLGIRLPEELKAKVQESAKDNGRSMNSEVISLLEAALRPKSEESNGQNDAVVEVLTKTINEMHKTIKVQTEALDLYKEQVALIKALVKRHTGYDIQAFLDSKVDYDALGVPRPEEYKKPT